MWSSSLMRMCWIEAISALSHKTWKLMRSQTRWRVWMPCISWLKIELCSSSVRLDIIHLSWETKALSWVPLSLSRRASMSQLMGSTWVSNQLLFQTPSSWLCQKPSSLSNSQLVVTFVCLLLAQSSSLSLLTPSSVKWKKSLRMSLLSLNWGPCSSKSTTVPN